jgi:PAT family beta-lactamase induction signal transducer AmpG
MVAILLLGFSSGLPLGLTASGSTFQAWLKESGISIGTIGLYTLKFLWSPLLDRYAPPLLDRRRGWILLTQLLLALSVLLMGQLPPASATQTVAALAFCIAFFSASQDIVIDAYRTEVLKPEERAAGSAMNILGYRIAMLTSGSLALILADTALPWSMVFVTMAVAFGLGILGTLIAEPPPAVGHPRTLDEAFKLPLIDYFSRRGAVEILIFIVLYKLGDSLAASLTTAFMLDIGFSKSDIGAVIKTLGLAATIGGSFLGSALMTRLGLRRSLVGFGLFQGAALVALVALAVVGRNYYVMVVAIGLDYLSSGMGTAALVVFIMSLCKSGYTATQYALLTSLTAMARVYIGSGTGYLQSAFGWPLFFVICTFMSLPGLAMVVWRYHRWEVERSDTDESMVPVEG